MPKRKKSVNGYQKRLKDRERKRRAREKAKTVDGPSGVPVTASSVPRGTEDGAVTAPLSNFLGKVPMGFPLKEEKPLARMQASLREKMHLPALRLPSPRGSRLFARSEGKAPSPDSPAWVCAPPRAPGSDTVHVSGSAGQAHLEDSRMESSYGNIKDEAFLTVPKQYSHSTTNSILKVSQNVLETIYDIDEVNDISDNAYDFNDDENVPNTRNPATFNQHAPKIGNYQVCRSVQGSFHQAHILFEENAGTQCVANCLAALSYHRLRNAMYWTSADMNRILMTGDELYTS